MIEFRNVDKEHAGLLALVKQLDAYYYARFGEAALHYKQFNGLEEVLDAVVGYEDGAPVACGCLKKIDAQTGEIKRIYVLPAYRRRGIARSIVNLLEEKARVRGLRAAILETGREMEDAVAFYKTGGYYEIENYGGFAGDDACICMKKDLGERT